MGIAILQLVIVVAGGMLLGIWITRYRTRLTKSPETDAEYRRAGFAVKSSRIHGGTVVTGAIEGAQFTLAIVPRSRSSPPTVVLRTPCALDGAFVVSSEDASDRYLKRVGMAGELQIGEADFDREVFIQSGAPGYLKSLFGQSQARDAVRALLRLGYHRVVLQRGVVSAYRYEAQQLPAPADMRPALDGLVALGATRGVISGAKAAKRLSSSAWIVMASLLVMVSSLVVGVTGIRNAPTLVDGQGATLTAIWFGIAAATITLGILAVASLRGRPTGPGEMAFIVFLVLPSLVVGMWGGLMSANQLFDGSTAAEHTAEGKRRHSVKHAYEREYYVEAATQRGRQFVTVLPQAQRHGQPGQLWLVRTRSGWLGLEWVESARPAPGPVKAESNSASSQPSNPAPQRQPAPVAAEVRIAPSQWLNSAQFQQEFNTVTRQGLYPHEVEGRCEAGGLQFRAHWKPRPAGLDYLAYAGMTRDDYERRNKEYGARGFSTGSVMQFKDCTSADRYSVTWLK